MPRTFVYDDGVPEAVKRKALFVVLAEPQAGLVDITPRVRTPASELPRRRGTTVHAWLRKHHGA